MPTSLQTVVAKKTAGGIVEGVEVAAPVAKEIVKKESEAWLRSRAARRSGLITGGLLFALTYGAMARHKRLQRIDEKLDRVAAEVVDEDG
ncbi:MAG: hypothetical protein ACJ77E_05375 [Gaiellaceae bacterium]